jgi:hypothetical protein
VVRGEIETPISFVLIGVPKKDTSIEMRGELMRSSGRGVRVAGAPEDPKVGVGGSCAEKSEVGGGG